MSQQDTGLEDSDKLPEVCPVCKKESKNTLKRFCNGKGDMLSSNLKRLYDVLHYEHNSY